MKSSRAVSAPREVGGDGSMRATLELAMLLCVVFVSSMGCNRAFYRKQADNEVYGLIDEKAQHVARPVNTVLRIDLDPRSRMFNPFDLDFQPMPLDDPASHRYMQCVDGRRGYPMWEAAGLTNTTENPVWWQYLPVDEDGILVLNADNAVQIALLHSTDYQEQLETLYLSALDVSSERFQFDTQFFGGAQSFFTADGRLRNGDGESSSTVSVGPYSTGRRPLSMERTFATGADLVVGLANNIVWELSGPNTQSASTVLDFALVQPLLRGAGRDRILERLTLSERRLLANVRAFERYRRGFYLNIVTGRNIDTTVRRSGGVFGVGLGGFTGLGGGFAGLGGGGGGGGGGGVAQAGGFIGLLQDQLQIRNLEENMARLGDNLLILENTLIELLTTIPDDPEAVLRQRLQIAQARSALLNQQTQLIGRRVGYQNSVDAFLRDLGLPPYLCARIDDPYLDRLELIDRDLRGRRQELINVRTAAGSTNVQLLEQVTQRIDQATGAITAELVWDDRTSQRVARLREVLVPLGDLAETLVDDDLPRVEKDLQTLAETLPERRLQTASLKELYDEERRTICSLLGIESIDESVFDIAPLDGLVTELADDYEVILQRLQGYPNQIDALIDAIDEFALTGAKEKDPQGTAATVRDQIVLASQTLLSDLSDDVLGLQLIQARARVESLLLPEVDIDPATALQIARVNRRDWANARAALVDSYRLIEFNADNLESSLDITFAGDMQNVGSNPFDLRSNAGRLRVGLQWDAPITRLQERNTYRQSLIEYEQAKRSYYSFEDGVWQSLRGTIRQLQANRLNFEIGRQSVRIAASQIELNEDIRRFRDARGLSSGPTAARDTISALEDLLDSQNGLLNLYVNFEVIRRGLDLDLGTMELTPDGMWIDPGELEPQALLRLAGTSNGGMIDCGAFNSGDHPCQVPGCGLTLEEQPIGAIYGF
ncbi:MAG: hypothetical protein AAGD07_10530 [Planctomycetota bacterium]